jgi:multidrug efflux pump subunit AcrA (membrane-fusion protein)
MKKILWSAAAFALLALLGYRTFHAIRQKQDIAPARDVRVAVTTGRPASGVITDRITQSGTILARADVTLYPKVAGTLARNLVEMDDRVRPDQVIALIDRDEVGYDFKQAPVRSTLRGTVAKVFLNPGAVVGPNTPLLQVVDIDRVKAVIAIPEEKIRFIRKGTPVDILAEAYPGEHFSGKVSAISPVANPLTRTIDVEVSMDNARHRLKPGMYIHGGIVLSRRTALLVPLASVTEREGQRVAFSLADSIVSMVPVTTGAVVGDSIEVVSGLTPATTVVVAGAHRLSNGARVMIGAVRP